MYKQKADKLKKVLNTVSPQSYKRIMSMTLTVLLLALFTVLSPEISTNNKQEVVKDSLTCSSPVVCEVKALTKSKPSKIVTPPRLSDKQLKTFQMIYKVAKAHPNRYNKTYEKTLLKIAMQESDMGTDLIGDKKHGQSITKASLGIFQFQIRTVRGLASQYKNLKWIKKHSDSWIAEKLLHDDKFSVMLASYNIRRLSEDGRRNTYLKVVSGWNGGIVNIKYYKHIQRHNKLVNHTIEFLASKDLIEPYKPHQYS